MKKYKIVGVLGILMIKNLILFNYLHFNINISAIIT